MIALALILRADRRHLYVFFSKGCTEDTQIIRQDQKVKAEHAGIIALKGSVCFVDT